MKRLGFLDSLVCLMVVASFALILRVLRLSKSLGSHSESIYQSDQLTFSFPGPDHPAQTIRKWGCNRTETPLIYIHIGKAGGGKIRARFAAVATGYTRKTNAWHKPYLDSHYYPLNQNGSLRATFCNSCFCNHLVVKNPKAGLPYSYEGNIPCNATTPLGRAIACPQPIMHVCRSCLSYHEDCRAIYAGHNALGTELHWLPTKVLQRWWRQFSYMHHHHQQQQRLSAALSTLMPGNKSWCPTQQQSRPRIRENAAQTYGSCGIPLSREMDPLFEQYWEATTDGRSNYASLYASLPVHRVLLVREPFSWLVSKLFWHNVGSNCADIDTASKGWAKQFLEEWLQQICGDDCAIRRYYGLMSLDEMTEQAEANLRYSISVVGLLNETSRFYNMITKRISYLDMSRNPQMTGPMHATSKTNETQYCSELYQTPVFQKQFQEHLPQLAAAVKLYKVAVEVNRFQQKELDACFV